MSDQVKHTPGPWTVVEYGDDDAPALVIHSDSETRVCFMATPGSYGDPATIEANARLMAAAPELLEALRAVDFTAEDADDNGNIRIHSEVFDLVCHAIAKATGGAP